MKLLFEIDINDRGGIPDNFIDNAEAIIKHNLSYFVPIKSVTYVPHRETREERLDPHVRAALGVKDGNT